MKREPPAPDTNPRAPIQLRLNFAGGNPLASLLRAGQFSILVEQQTPLSEQPFQSAMTLSEALARRIGSTDLVSGIAVTDRQRSEACHDPVDTGEILAEASHKPVLMVLSGKGSSRDRVRDCLARAASKSIRTVLAVTGDRSDRHPVRKMAGGYLAPYAGGYLDSVDMLRIIRSSTNGLYAGAGVNPFKYNVADQYLQYYKMLRKLACGAQFLVTHAGWDMKKYQELQWFLRLREVEVPVLARVALLHAEDISTIHEGAYPGVHLARLFAATLQRESNLSATQCLAAQLQRVALQIVGCKLLGYSGVMLSGIRDAKTLDMVLAQIQESVTNCQTYGDWLRAWTEFHNGIDFAPKTGAFYLFKELLSADRQYYAESGCTLTDMPWPEPARSDRWRSFWLDLLLAPGAPAWVAGTARVLGCRRCPHAGCNFERCLHLCPRDCPKALVGGACGGTYPDGTCEFGHAPCFYHRVVAIAAHRHALDRLEEGIPGD